MGRGRLGGRRPDRQVGATKVPVDTTRALTRAQVAAPAPGQPGATAGELEELRGWTLHQLRHSLLTQ